MCANNIYMNKKWDQCKVDGCDRPKPYRHGYCGLHYNRWKNNGNPLVVKQSGAKKKYIVCQYEDCLNSNGLARGYCQKHYTRLRRNGSLELLSPEKPEFTRRQQSDKQGYIRLHFRDGRTQYEHRYVMEQFLGRQLFPGENVHHLNGVRNDSRIENLELWSTSQPAGQRVVDKLNWAFEFLESYGYKVDDIRNGDTGSTPLRTDGKRWSCGHLHAAENLCAMQTV